MKTDAFASIRPTKLKFYLRCLDEMGINTAEMLNGTDITRAKLDDRFSLVSFSSYIKFVSNMLARTNQPGLAFEFGRMLRLADLSVLGHAFIASSTAMEGYALWQKYNYLFFGNLVGIKEFEQGGLRWFEFVPRVDLQFHLLQFFIEEKYSIEFALMRRLNNCFTGTRYSSFAYSRPGHAHYYEEILDAEVLFGAERFLHAIALDDPSYQGSLPGSDPETLELCTGYLEYLSNVAESKTTFSARVHSTVKKHLPQILSLAELAQLFNVSERKLTRTLESEGMTYNQILAKAREETVKNFILTTRMSTSEIAYAVGFSEVGSLRRSFKAWTDMTLGDYKKNVATVFDS